MMRGCSRWYTKYDSDITMPASTPQYSSGAATRVMTKVMAAITASTRARRHSRTNSRGLSRPSTAATTIAASTACGTKRSTGVNTSSASSTTRAEKMVAQPVCAPAYRLSAERENDELVANAPDRPEAILASPWPIRSWSWSQRSPLRSESTLADEAVSRKLTSVITSTGSTSWPSMSQPGQPGSSSPGRPCGSWPTTRPPCASKPSAQLSPAAASTTSSTVGKLGLKRLAASSTTTVTTPNAAAAQCRAGACSMCSQLPAKPSMAGSCEPMISTAAACVKAISTGELTRLSSQPKRARPSATCSRPVSSASHTARVTHCGLPGWARPVSEAAISSAVSAVGPTESRCDDENSTATSAGRMEA